MKEGISSNRFDATNREDDSGLGGGTNCDVSKTQIAHKKNRSIILIKVG